MGEVPRNWIRGIEPAAWVGDAAETIVGARLVPVVEWITSITDDGAASIRQVHRLRVATRRADAAIRAFRPCFKPSRWKRMRKILRNLRRSAADARTADVHAEMLSDMRAALKTKASPDTREALEHAIRRCKRERTAAAEQVLDAIRSWRPKRVQRAVDRLLATAATPAEGPRTYQDAADRLYARHHGRLEKAKSNADDWSGLHALRVAGKKVRYSMELIAPCDGRRAFARRYETLTEMQSRLGAINDAHELAERLARYADERDPDDERPTSSVRRALRRLAEHEAQRRVELRDEFTAFCRDLDGRP